MARFARVVFVRRRPSAFCRTNQPGRECCDFSAHQHESGRLNYCPFCHSGCAIDLLRLRVDTEWQEVDRWRSDFRLLDPHIDHRRCPRHQHWYLYRQHFFGGCAAGQGNLDGLRGPASSGHCPPHQYQPGGLGYYPFGHARCAVSRFRLPVGKGWHRVGRWRPDFRVLNADVDRHRFPVHRQRNLYCEPLCDRRAAGHGELLGLCRGPTGYSKPRDHNQRRRGDPHRKCNRRFARVSMELAGTAHPWRHQQCPDVC